MRYRAGVAAALLALVGLVGAQAQAQPTGGGGFHSGQSELSGKPFLALGVHPLTRQVTGYIAALRTAPGRTDECKFLFRGTPGADGKVRLAIKDVATGTTSPPATAAGAPAILSAAGSAVRIELPSTLAPGDCDWILGFLDGTGVRTAEDRFILSVDIGHKEDWIAVALVRARRAYFHDMPDARTVRKGFVVAGDLVHVLEEKPGWYRVRYGDGARETSGWIRAVDTVQF